MNQQSSPLYKKCCGQLCVAKILNITIEKSIEFFGHRKGTKTRELIRILEQNGYTCSQRLIPLKQQELPELCICKLIPVQRKKGNWHWIIHQNGTFYDPFTGCYYSKEQLLALYNQSVMITSYLKVEKKITRFYQSF